MRPETIPMRPETGPQERAPGPQVRTSLDPGWPRYVVAGSLSPWSGSRASAER